jgi:hypothetical protein
MPGSLPLHDGNTQRADLLFARGMGRGHDSPRPCLITDRPEILLFPVARTGLSERIRVPGAADCSRSLGEQ